jgi:nicotinamidase-related amidase
MYAKREFPCIIRDNNRTPERTQHKETIMRILPENTCGVVIDVQERLFPHIHGHEELEKRIGILVRGLQILGIPLIQLEQYRKGLGPTIPSLQEILGTLEPIEKMCFSCLDAPEFVTALKETQRKTVILTGIETHVCVLQSAMDLLEAGYLPVVPADAVSSRKVPDKETALSRIAASGGVVTTTESLLLELCRYADNPVFKELSRLIK